MLSVLHLWDATPQPAATTAPSSIEPTAGLPGLAVTAQPSLETMDLVRDVET